MILDCTGVRPIDCRVFPKQLVQGIGLATAGEDVSVIRSRRGCGKCGKAESFCARLFQASCGNPRFLRISTDAALSTGLRARRFFRVVEESDISNGKTGLVEKPLQAY